MEDDLEIEKLPRTRGRQSLGERPMVKVGIRLHPKEASWLRHKYNNNLSTGARDSLQHCRNKHGLKYTA